MSNQKHEKENFPTENIEEQYDRHIRERYSQIKTQRTLQTMIGGPEDLIPFAWRHPLKIVNRKKASKFLRSMAAAEAERKSKNPEEL